MNLTLWNYMGSSTQGHKELFYEIINPLVTVASTAPAALQYDLTTAAQTNNQVQLNTNSLAVQFTGFVPTTNDIVELKISSHGMGIKLLQSFTNTWTDGTYTYTFFDRIELVFAQKLLNDGVTNVPFPNTEISNDFSDLYGYDWAKVHSASAVTTTHSATSALYQMPECPITTVLYTSTMNSIISTEEAVDFLTMTFTTVCIISENSTLVVSSTLTSDVEFLPSNYPHCESSFRSLGCWTTDGSQVNIRFG
jgi:hypothetical protein